MAGFKSASISDRSLQILSMISQSTDEGVLLSTLLCTLGQCVSVCPPPIDQRKQLLNLFWIHVTQIKDLNEYINCIAAWIAFIAQHFSTKEVNTILGDIVDRIQSNRNSNELFLIELKVIIQKILMYMMDFENLLAMANILPFVNLCHEESVKVDISKLILSSINLSTAVGETQKTCDPITINALMFLGSILHDSVNALTPEDEYRQIGEILCSIIMRIDYGDDFEQQLQFYVDSRAAFANLDIVLAELVQCVNRLEVNIKKQLKGHYHTRKTADFVRACAAYCFITIPSIESSFVRLKLYLLSGQVCLYNSCFGQADACFKAILTTIQSFPSPSSQEVQLFLLSFIRQCFSVLLIVPDNPEKGILNLVRLFLNVLRTFEWDQSNQYLGSIYINVIDLFSIMAQETYPYHIEKVESNDFLWGSDPKFIEDINRMISIIIEELLKLLQTLGQCKRQYQIAFDLFIRIVLRSDLTFKETGQLAVNLWNLCRKNEFSDVKYMVQTKTYLANQSAKLNNKPLKQLLALLQ